MALPLERLDTRTFDALVAEARALVPRSSPAWTDHNYHDPGVTLVELFAWLVEADFYRLDRTPEANLRAFLRLVGTEPRPPLVAETVLVLARRLAASGLALPPRLQVESARGDLVFQTADPLYVSPARLVAILSGTAASLEDHTFDGGPGGRPFPAFGRDPAPGSALYLGFDEPLAATAETVSLHFWIGDVAADRALRGRLVAEAEAAAREAADDTRCGDRVTGDWRLHYGARTRWEYYGTSADHWTPLADVVDETRALTLGGFVRFTAPANIAPMPPESAPPGGAARYYVRCRLASGAYDCPPAIRAVAINAVRARHEEDVASLDAPCVSTGRAWQAIELRRAPVVPGSLHVEISVNGVADGTWSEAREWDRVGPHDRTFRVEYEEGRLTFGNGRAGRVPPAGAAIRVSYAAGGGPAGNAPAGALTEPSRSARNATLVPGWALLRETLVVAQPFAAEGGAPAESLAEAEAGAIETLAGPDRAVTLADFETLALATPGVSVARAFAIADHHPRFACVTASGCVTVVVVPRCPDRRPTPSAAMLAEVARYLERRRTLTTELHVVAPCYRTVAVHARLHSTGPVADRPPLVERAGRALDEFLHPLRGGPDGRGWPVGRDVYRAEVMALLGGLPGVSHVVDLELQVGGEDAARCGNAGVCRTGLVAPGEHRISIA